MAIELFRQLEDLEQQPESFERDVRIAEIITKLENLLGA